MPLAQDDRSHPVKPGPHLKQRLTQNFPYAQGLLRESQDPAQVHMEARGDVVRTQEGSMGGIWQIHSWRWERLSWALNHL